MGKSTKNNKSNFSVDASGINETIKKIQEDYDKQLQDMRKQHTNKIDSLKKQSQDVMSSNQGQLQEMRKRKQQEMSELRERQQPQQSGKGQQNQERVDDLRDRGQNYAQQERRSPAVSPDSSLYRRDRGNIGDSPDRKTLPIQEQRVDNQIRSTRPVNIGDSPDREILPIQEQIKRDRGNIRDSPDRETLPIEPGQEQRVDNHIRSTRPVNIGDSPDRETLPIEGQIERRDRVDNQIRSTRPATDQRSNRYNAIDRRLSDEVPNQRR